MGGKCICTTLRQAAAQSTAHYDAVLAPSGLRVTMFRLLRKIDAAKTISITELAELVGLDRSTLGRNLRVLEKQSLVKFMTGDDERSRLVALTHIGKTQLQIAIPFWQEAQDTFAQIIAPDVMAVLDSVGRATNDKKTAIGDSA